MSKLAYVLKNKRTTLEKAEKFISTTEWTDCNLISKLYKKTAPVSGLKHIAVPDRISLDEAVKCLANDGKPAKIGDSFGPTWSSHWFELVLDIPSDWLGERVRLVWSCDAECLLWRDGAPAQGFTNENRRTEYVITQSSTGESSLVLYVEMVCMGLFGAGQNSQIGPPDPNRTFKLHQVHLTVVNEDVYRSIRDLEIITGLAKELPEDCNRGQQALYTANHIVNIIKENGDYQHAHQVANSFFKQSNGSSQHQLMAVGHCHIDTAWLWTYADTIKKCARSFSSTIQLMEQYPQYTFVCSQAQQFEWVQQHYPALYTDIKHWVKEGRFIPIGGTWVEMDGLIPSGESFIRQFLFGQRFFMREFGIKCTEFWLPDTFGYSSQLPQIMKLAGCERFVTQKLSWSLVNKFPHSTFWWEGLDGTRVLTHFPPADTYNSQADVRDVVNSLRNFRDKGRSNSSLLLYGWGDGGQGPTRDMIERLQRMSDIDGCPKVKMGTPHEYFSEVEASDKDNLCHWSGELYLELHNGTYTTQAKTKQLNRRCETLLHKTEALCTMAHTHHPRYPYPSAVLDRLWRLLLLNQFHDVLPGSSIGEVYRDARNHYQDIQQSAGKLISSAVEQLLNTGVAPEGRSLPVVFNTLGWSRQEVLVLPADCALPGDLPESAYQLDYTGRHLVFASAPPYGYQVFTPVDCRPVSIHKQLGHSDCVVMRNELLEAVIDAMGRVTSLRLLSDDRDAVAPGQVANQFVIFDDVPLYWDAWDVMDYHLEIRKPLKEVLQFAMIIEDGPLRCTVQVKYKVSDCSLLDQLIILDSGCPYLKFETEVFWHESHKFLKVEFPLNVRASAATYETQFGWLQRPTHQNTSWDWAKFEVCGHRWADLSEYDWGVAILNDSKYGWSCFGNVLRLSLLRSSKSPDDKADMGRQVFTYAMMPHTGTFQSSGVIEAASELNCPLDYVNNYLPPSPPDMSFVSVNQRAIHLDTVKKAEEVPNTFVLRLYEAYGSRTSATVQLHVPVKEAFLCNILEEVQHSLLVQNNSVTVKFTPFQIVTILCQC